MADPLFRIDLTAEELALLRLCLTGRRDHCASAVETFEAAAIGRIARDPEAMQRRRDNAALYRQWTAETDAMLVRLDPAAMRVITRRV